MEVVIDQNFSLDQESEGGSGIHHIGCGSDTYKDVGFAIWAAQSSKVSLELW